MLAFLIAAWFQAVDPLDERFDIYIQSCQTHYEKDLAVIDDYFRTGKSPPSPPPFWETLPIVERADAKAICTAWLLGMRYQMGQTKLASPRP